MAGSFADPRAPQTQTCVQHRGVNFLLKRNVDANISNLEKTLPFSIHYQPIQQEFVCFVINIMHDWEAVDQIFFCFHSAQTLYLILSPFPIS